MYICQISGKLSHGHYTGSVLRTNYSGRHNICKLSVLLTAHKDDVMCRRITTLHVASNQNLNFNGFSTNETWWIVNINNFQVVRSFLHIKYSHLFICTYLACFSFLLKSVLNDNFCDECWMGLCVYSATTDVTKHCVLSLFSRCACMYNTVKYSNIIFVLFIVY